MVRILLLLPKEWSLPEEVLALLALPDDRLGIDLNSKSVNADSAQVFVLMYTYWFPVDYGHSLVPGEVHHHLLGFCDIQLWAGAVTPFYEL